MRARLTKLGAALTAVAALAVGGSALASAAQKSAPPSPPAAQSQTADPATSSDPAESTLEAPAGAADTDNVQQGDQTGTDAAGAQSEQAGSESGPSDGPGGYADANPNADTQQQGEH